MDYADNVINNIAYISIMVNLVSTRGNSYPSAIWVAEICRAPSSAGVGDAHRSSMLTAEARTVGYQGSCYYTNK